MIQLFMDFLRVFEILSKHHLELSSLEAETVRRRQQMKEFADIGVYDTIVYGFFTSV